MSLIHNERMKLLAGTLNSVAVAIIVGGVVAPLLAATYGVPGTVSGSGSGGAWPFC